MKPSLVKAAFLPLLCLYFTNTFALETPLLNTDYIELKDLPLYPQEIESRPASPDWLLQKGQQMMYLELVSSTSEYICIAPATKIIANDVTQHLNYRLNEASGSGVILGRVKDRDFKDFSEPCGGNNAQYPTARVFIKVSPGVMESHGLLEGTDVRMVSDNESGRNNVSDVPIKLQVFKGSSWITIGGVNTAGFSRSQWVVDPVDNNETALLLVAEVGLVVQSASSNNQPSPRAASSRNSRLFTLAGYENVQRFLPGAAPAPVIAWGASQSDRLLKFEVNSSASNPSEGLYCVHPVYGPDGEEVSFVLNRDTGYYVTGAQRSTDADCADNAILSFSAMVSIDTSTSLDGEVYFIVQGANSSASNELFVLSDAQITLKKNRGRETLARYSPDEGGQWVQGAGEIPSLYIGPDIAERTLRFIDHSAGNVAASLTLDGSLVDYASTSYAVGSNFELAWNAEVASVSEINICEKSRCQNIVGSFVPDTNPVTIDSLRFAGMQDAALEFFWGDPGPQISSDNALANQEKDAPEPEESVEENAAVIAANPAATSPELRLKTHINFGDYRKPLTTCVGRLVLAGNENEAGSVFSLRQGDQVVSGDAWKVSDDESANELEIRFDRNRNDGPCAVEGLHGASTYSKDELLAQAALGPLEVSIPSPKPLFVSYMQLFGQEYKKSRARWLDSLTFFDRVYAHGRSSNLWIDAIVLGAGESRGELVPMLDLPGNFANQLGSEAQRDAVVDVQVGRPDVLTVNFESGLKSIAQIVGDAQISLLYFDDSMEAFTCDDYDYELDASGLSVLSAVVITAKSNYSGDDSLRSVGSGLAHVCAETDTRVTVYGFDASEMHKERQWDEMFGAVFEDLTNGI